MKSVLQIVPPPLPRAARGDEHRTFSRGCGIADAEELDTLHRTLNTEHRSSNDPLHGITLEKLLTELVAQLGWEGLADEVDVRCFRFDPSIKSSLVFLRKTPWARTKVEQLYVRWKRGAKDQGPKTRDERPESEG